MTSVVNMMEVLHYSNNVSFKIRSLVRLYVRCRSICTFLKEV